MSGMHALSTEAVKAVHDGERHAPHAYPPFNFVEVGIVPIFIIVLS
jgi:hypothetical protein